MAALGEDTAVFFLLIGWNLRACGGNEPIDNACAAGQGREPCNTGARDKQGCKQWPKHEVVKGGRRHKRGCNAKNLFDGNTKQRKPDGHCRPRRVTHDKIQPLNAKVLKKGLQVVGHLAQPMGGMAQAVSCIVAGQIGNQKVKALCLAVMVCLVTLKQLI